MTPRSQAAEDDFEVVVRPWHIAVFVLLIIGLVLLIMAWTTIQGGHVGVIKRFGAVQEQTFDPGLHFRNPFTQSVEVVDVRLAPFEVKADAASSDAQDVSAIISVQYGINPALAPEMINNLGSRENLQSGYLMPAVQEAVKASTAKYTAKGLITSRPTVKAEMHAAAQKLINDALLSKGLDKLVNIASMNVVNFSFSDTFNASIEATMQADQKTVQAQAEKTRRITEAEAAAAEVTQAADAAAYKIKVEGENRAKAIEAEGAAIRANPQILQMRAIERWGGEVPRTQLGSSTQIVPFLNLEPTDAAAPNQRAQR
jgi:regulator of protease activity HflC (stomatin/prohibitin superfamily)